jgi:alkylation response protein AidB-like acyl-CoA dehydrogenase
VFRYSIAERLHLVSSSHGWEILRYRLGLCGICEVVAGRVSADHILGGGRIHHAMPTIALLHEACDMMLERAVSRRTARGPSLQLAEQPVAESWIEIEQFRPHVLRTARLVRGQLSTGKAKMLDALPDVAQPAMHQHGALGISNEMPFTEMIVESVVMALADGRTEGHRSHSPASGRNRMHAVAATDLVTAESALDRTGRLATC